MGKRRVYNCEAFRVDVVSEWEDYDITGGKRREDGTGSVVSVKFMNAELVKLP